MQKKGSISHKILKHKIVSLFSGCGGLDLGFENSGFNIVAAFDNWEPAIEVYKNNFNHPIFQRNLANTSNLDDILTYKPDIIIGGPPCQDFSSAGHRDESLGRADLTLSYSRIICKALPQYFVMENVPRIQKSDILNKIIKQLKNAGYGLTQVVLDASLCGVPQKRKRFVMVGELGGNDDFLIDSLTIGQSTKAMTMFDYFGSKLGFEYYFRVPRSYNRRGIYSIYEPSMTIRGVDRPVPKGYPGHPADPIEMNPEIRNLTFKERSLIQTFPENFSFVGSKTNINMMIGNAVPVKLAEYIANTLKEYIIKKNEKTKID